MSIWKTKCDIDEINRNSRNTLIEHLGIEFIEVGEDYVKASMPVDYRTCQPMGFLHGGASVALAETVGSVASNMTVTPPKYCLGMEINANHISSLKEGTVVATAKPIHLGQTTQVWNIMITDVNEKIVCVSRLTMSVR